jgi:predicted lipoprotein with Yx(FWY)xxD motif
MKRFRLAAIGGALLMLLAACGGGGGGGAYGGGDSASPSPSESMATDDSGGQTAAASVMVTDSSLGKILTDSKGMTLYLYDPDAQGASTCYDACEDAWPVLTVPDEDQAIAGDGADQSLVGTTDRTDGSYQVTYNKWPLYYFAQDAAPGDVKGQGKGGVWWVVDATGKAVGK